MKPLLEAGCGYRKPYQIVSPQGPLQEMVWEEAEKSREVVIRNLRTSKEASFHLVLLKDAEKPHVHDGHDLIAVVLRGKVSMHFADGTVKVQKGDVVEIPRGTLHWAENRGKEASLAYAVFTPPFDGEDYRLVRAS